MNILQQALERLNRPAQPNLTAPNPVSRSDVEMLFRLFLHREPESDAVIAEFQKLGSMESVCKVFLESEEFKAKFARFSVPLEWPPIQVDIHAQGSDAANLLNHVERTWRHLGQSDPYWSVISRPEFHNAQFDQNADLFHDTGRIDVMRLQAFAARSGIDLAQFSSCLELGCGVGRVTQWLAKTFPKVAAVDLSSEHLAIIRRDLPAKNVEPILLTTLDDLTSLPEFDVFFSVIVLQHNPPPIMASMLRTILQQLRPGGIAYFQLPTYRKSYAFRAAEYLNSLPSAGEMEMHVLPQAAVFTIAAASNCAVLEVREDGYTADIQGISNTFFLRKH